MKVDMSPQAIADRLRQVSQLRRLCLSLGKAKPKSSSSKTRRHRSSGKTNYSERPKKVVIARSKATRQSQEIALLRSQ